jgi:hypothetical protein
MRKLEDLPLVQPQLKEPPPNATMERSLFSVSELIERLTRRPVRHSILAPWVSTKGIAGTRMQGLQRTRASALTRASVCYPGFLFVGIHLRCSISAEYKTIL